MRTLFVRMVFGILLAVFIAWAGGSAVVLLAEPGRPADGSSDLLDAQLQVIGDDLDRLDSTERESHLRSLRPLFRGPLHIEPQGSKVSPNHTTYTLSDGSVLTAVPPPPRPSLARGLALQGLFILLSVSAVAWALAFPMARELRTLETAVGRLRAGELDARVPESRGPVGPLAAEFNRLAARVQSLLLGQRDLLRAVSHELRTPLARLRFQVEELAEGADPAMVRAVDEELDEVDALIAELMDWLRAEAALGEQTDVNVTEVAKRSAMRFEDDNIAIHVDMGTVVVHSTERDVERIVDNLISNALRYADQKIRVSARSHASGWELCVDDDGPGFPESAQRLLEPFATADESRADGRNGLGLSIVQRIVTRYGGQVSLERSPELGGARVRIVIG